ncbi:MFS family permease [Bradyrhizobium sp. USDA 4341]
MRAAANIVAAEKLPDEVPLEVSIPFILGSISLAASYGSSFLLVDALRSAPQSASVAGAVISTGTVATILCSLVAGRIADLLGVMRTITLAAAVMAIAMICFAAAPAFMLLAYLGGLSLGIGWSIFYMLAPLQILERVRPAARVKYLTLLSGSQMLGIGLAVPLARTVAEISASYIAVYSLFAAACLVGAMLLELAGRALAQAPQIKMATVRLTFEGVREAFKSKTRYPIVMIGIGACVFSGLSTFQTLYASSRGQSADTFFLVFTLTAVFLRFAVAFVIGKVRLEWVAAFLIVCTIAGLFLLLMNAGSAEIYILGTAIFALGYGLSYSTLNGMVVLIASTDGTSLAVASQVFTLSYFVGLFGFPYIAGRILSAHSFDDLLMIMMMLVGGNGIVLAIQVFSTSPER